MKYLLIILISITFIACGNDDKKADAYGNFEADEIIISSEANGRVLELFFEEGQGFEQGQQLALIDTLQLSLKRDQIIASMGAIDSKTQNIRIQVDVLERQKENLLREKSRIEKLFVDSAATEKQLDDINGELDVMNKRISATRSSMQTGNQGLLSEKDPLSIQLKMTEDQLKKCRVTTPIKGRILNKYIEEGEFASIGKPICKIANLDKMTLRAYISAKQLDNIKLGQKVNVAIDKNEEEMKYYEAEIEWIAEKSEFTPKLIQTKEERVNLVYAIKVSVVNDGSIKIGMPGEVYLNGK